MSDYPADRDLYRIAATPVNPMPYATGLDDLPDDLKGSLYFDGEDQTRLDRNGNPVADPMPWDGRGVKWTETAEALYVDGVKLAVGDQIMFHNEQGERRIVTMGKPIDDASTYDWDADEDFEPVAPPAPAELACGVWIREDICNGNPCVVGQRLPVRAIMSFHCEGFTPAEIVEQYPTATVEQVNAAIRWHAEHLRAARAEAKAQRVADETSVDLPVPPEMIQRAALAACIAVLREVGHVEAVREFEAMAAKMDAASIDDIPTLPQSALRTWEG